MVLRPEQIFVFLNILEQIFLSAAYQAYPQQAAADMAAKRAEESRKRLEAERGAADQRSSGLTSGGGTQTHNQETRVVGKGDFQTTANAGESNRSSKQKLFGEYVGKSMGDCACGFGCFCFD